jgi:hypothetical protein
VRWSDLGQVMAHIHDEEIEELLDLPIGRPN